MVATPTPEQRAEERRRKQYQLGQFETALPYAAPHPPPPPKGLPVYRGPGMGELVGYTERPRSRERLEEGLPAIPAGYGLPATPAGEVPEYATYVAEREVEQELGKAMQQYAPKATVEELRQFMQEEPDNFLDMVQGWGRTPETELIVSQVVPGEVTETDVDMIFGAGRTQEFIDAVTPLIGVAYPNLGEAAYPEAMKQIMQNPAQLVEQLWGKGVTPETYELMRFLYPEARGKELKDYLRGDIDKDKRGWFGKFWGAITAGGGDIFESMGGALKWMGAEEFGGFSAEVGRSLQQAAPLGGGIGWDFVRAGPLMATLMIPGMGGYMAGRAVAQAGITLATGAARYGATAAAIGRIGPFAEHVLGALGAASVARPLESFMEAGAAYEQALASGMSRGDASDAAGEVFKRNMRLLGLDAVQFAVALAPIANLGSLRSLVNKGLLRTVTNRAGQLVAVGLSEAGEEYYQEVVQRQALGQEVQFWDIPGNLSEEEFRKVAVLGAMWGVVPGLGANIIATVARVSERNFNPELNMEFVRKVANHVRTGMTVKNAKLLAMDELVGENEEAAAIVENVTKRANIEWTAGQIRAKNEADAAAWNIEFERQRAELGEISGIEPVTVQAVRGVRAEMPADAQQELGRIAEHKFGQPFAALNRSQTMRVLEDYEGVVPTQDMDFILKKASNPSKGLNLEDQVEMRPQLFYGGVTAHVATDGFVMYLDPNVADELLNDALKKIEQREIKTRMRLRPDLSLAEATAEVKEWTKQQIEANKEKFPNYQQLIPSEENRGTPARVVAIERGYPPSAYLWNGSVLARLNLDILSLALKHHPDATILVNTASGPITFMVGDEVKVVAMPVSIEQKAELVKRAAGLEGVQEAAAAVPPPAVEAEGVGDTDAAIRQFQKARRTAEKAKSERMGKFVAGLEGAIERAEVEAGITPPAKQPWEMTREEYRNLPQIPVFRGVGPRGMAELVKAEQGVHGPGVYFYKRPQDAAAYASPGGGIIVAYVSSQDATVYDDGVVVVPDADMVQRVGNIPTAETVDLKSLNHKAAEVLADYPELQQKAETKLPPAPVVPLGTTGVVIGPPPVEVPVEPSETPEVVVEEGPVDWRLLQKRDRIRTRLEKLNKAIEQSDRTDMPGTYVTGASGVPGKRMKKVEQQMERRINRASEVVRLTEELRSVEGQIEYQRRAPQRIETAKHVAEYEQVQLDSIEVGDSIDVGGNVPLKVIKKNPKSVITEGGSKWTAREIGRVISQQRTSEPMPITEPVAEAAVEEAEVVAETVVEEPAAEPAKKGKKPKAEKPPPAEPTPEVKKLRSTIMAAVSFKGLPKVHYENLFRKHGKSVHLTKMTQEQLQATLEAVREARPKTIKGHRVITRKTEHKIELLKATLLREKKLTEESFERLKAALNLRVEGYISGERYITESDGKALIRAMNDEADWMAEEIATEDGLAAHPAIARERNIIQGEMTPEPELEGKPVRIGYGSELRSMRYYVEKLGPKLAKQWNMINMTHLARRQYEQHLLNRLEDVAGKDDFKDIAGNDAAMRRVEDYIATKHKASGVKSPTDMTDAEVAVAEELERQLFQFQNDVRFARFKNAFAEHGGDVQLIQNEIPSAPKQALRRAVDIFESKGDTALREFLDTQDWGVIRSGYSPLSIVKPHLYLFKPKVTTFGKGHIKTRQGNEFTQEDRNILDRYRSYMRQLYGLIHVQPQVRTFARTFEEEAGKFENPQHIAGVLSRDLNIMKGYREHGGLFHWAAQRLYSQFAAATFWQPYMAVRNLHQNLAFNPDTVLTFDRRNRRVNPERRLWFEIFVAQDKGLVQDYLMRGVKPLDLNDALYFFRKLGLNVSTSAAPMDKLLRMANRTSAFPWSDKVNRLWTFWLRSNRVDRAVTEFERDGDVHRLLERSGTNELTKLQQVHALELLGRESVDYGIEGMEPVSGKEAFLRYVTQQHVNNVQFLYDRAQRAPAEHGPTGEIMGNILVFQRSWAERMLLQLGKLDPKADVPAKERYEAAKNVAYIIVAGMMAGWLFGLMTGKRYNPYNPLNILQYSPGGLLLASFTMIGDTVGYIVDASQGNEYAMGKLPDMISRTAKQGLPFYKITVQAIDSATDRKHVDKEAMRKIRGMIDEQYRLNGGQYEVDRSLAEALQHAIFGATTQPPTPTEKAADAVARLGEPVDEEDLIWSTEEPDIYGMNDLSTELRSIFSGMTPDEVIGDTDSPIVKSWAEKEKAREIYNSFPSTPLSEITDVYADTSLSRRDVELIQEYHDLPEAEQEAFLEEHPELTVNRREDWLKANPEQNALLSIWGGPKLSTLEGYNKASSMLDEMDVPSSFVEGIPPKNVAESVFEYQDLIDQYSPGSSEAILWRMEHPAYLDWAGLDEPDHNIEVMRINVDYRQQDDTYEELKPGGDRDAYLIENPEYAEARRRRDAYQKGVAERFIPEYVDYYMQDFDSERERVKYLTGHVGLADEMVRLGHWKEPEWDILLRPPGVRPGELYYVGEEVVR